MTASIKQDTRQYLSNGAHYSEVCLSTPFAPPPTGVVPPAFVCAQIGAVEMMGPAGGASMRKINHSLGLYLCG
jgi:hypothetical protein